MIQENFTATLAASLRRHWDVDCYTDLDGPTLKYSEVALRIKELHHVFDGLGLEKGDRIGLVINYDIPWNPAVLDQRIDGTLGEQGGE